MSRFQQLVFSVFPEPIKSGLRYLRKNYQSYLDRLIFPFWLIYQCVRHRRKAVVFWRTAALGDVICTLPVLNEIRKRHPKSILIFVTLRAFKSIIFLSKETDLVYGISHTYGKPAWIDSVSWRCCGLIEESYEALTTDEQSPGTGSKTHLVDDLAASCGFTVTDRQPHLFPSLELLEKARIRYGLNEDWVKGRLLIGINGGHTWPVREWDVNKWQKVIDMIHAEYDAVIIRFGLNRGTGVYDEYDQLKEVRSLANQLSQEDLVGLIASCHLVISIDSGPVHIAGAVGTPVIGVFGAVNPLYRLPPSSPAAGLFSDVPCLFCHHETPCGHWQTGCRYDIRCMKQLESESVFPLIRAALQNVTVAFSESKFVQLKGDS